MAGRTQKVIQHADHFLYLEVNFLPKHNPKFSTDLYFLKMDQLEEDYPR